MKDVGVVDAIWTYPVKSMAGQSLSMTKVGWHGVAEDRRFAFQKTEDRSGLPWLSAREVPQMILYHPRLPQTGRVDGSSIVVQCPDGGAAVLESPELLERIAVAADQPIRLTQLWRGTFDSMPLSLISTASIQDIEARTGRHLHAERFRPNIVIRTLDDRPFTEDKWVSERLTVGDQNERLCVHVTRKDPRCRVVNLDPETAEEDPQVLACIVKDRKNMLGVYAAVEFPATIRVGDHVRLRD